MQGGSISQAGEADEIGCEAPSSTDVTHWKTDAPGAIRTRDLQLRRTERGSTTGLTRPRSWRPNRRPLFGPGIDEPLAMSRGRNAYDYAVDDLGSGAEVTDGNATVQDS